MNYSGVPSSVQFAIDQIPIDAELIDQPTAMLAFEHGNQPLILKLQLTDDRWLHAKMAAVAIMRDAVLNAKELDVNFDEISSVMLTVRLHR